MAWSSVLMSGATLAMGRRFTAGGFWDECRQHGATVIAYIGEVPRYLMAQPPSNSDRDHRVRAAVGVGFRSDLWQPFVERFGVEQICELYGASESNTLFFNVLGLPSTIGFCPSPHALVRYDADTDSPVTDANGHFIEVPAGEPGLLIGKITPRYPFDGYTSDSASASKLFISPFGKGERWFNSGDLLKKIGFGHAVFVDRVGDTFRWKSENVSTAEVESALNGSDTIEEATVYGVEVPGCEGRAGMAAFTSVSASIDLKTLLDELESKLPGYAVPVFLRQVAALETTGTFKHKKADLRKQGFSLENGDPVWVRTGGQYMSVDAVLMGQITRGELRL
jgi:acyl-CoA synthetase (AMP-forming)/AMP-acid ligase II